MVRKFQFHPVASWGLSLGRQDCDSFAILPCRGCDFTFLKGEWIPLLYIMEIRVLFYLHILYSRKHISQDSNYRNCYTLYNHICTCTRMHAHTQSCDSTSITYAIYAFICMFAHIIVGQFRGFAFSMCCIIICRCDIPIHVHPHNQNGVPLCSS